MRPLIDSMIVLMLICLTVGAVVYQESTRRQARNREVVREGLFEFQEQVTLHGAIDLGVDRDAGQYPPHLEPHWFQWGAPQNPLVSSGRPWMDIAPQEDFSDQPPDPLATSNLQAAFWYNPHNGVVRARVPRQVSERLTLELYNQVNQTALSVLPDDRDPLRTPLTFNLSPTTRGQHASLIKRMVGRVQADEPVAQEAGQAQEPAPWWHKPPASAKQPEPADVESEPSMRPSLLSE